MASGVNDSLSNKKNTNESPASSSDLSTNPSTELITRTALRYDFQNMMPKEELVHLNSVSTGTPLFIVHPVAGIYVYIIQ